LEYRTTTNAEYLEGSGAVAQCAICGKTRSFGHNVSHSKRRTNRDFKPNVHRKRLMIGGKLVRLEVCTRCMRTAMKAASA